MNSQQEWTGGLIAADVRCVLAPNPSPWTLEGTNTYLIGEVGGRAVVKIEHSQLLRSRVLSGTTSNREEQKSGVERPGRTIDPLIFRRKGKAN